MANWRLLPFLSLAPAPAWHPPQERVSEARVGAPWKRRRPSSTTGVAEGQRPLHRRVDHDLGLPAERELVGEHGRELVLGGQAEVLAGHALQRPRHVLDDGTDREHPERAVARRPVARPAGGSREREGIPSGRDIALVRCCRDLHAQRVRGAAQHAGLVEPVQVLGEESEPAQELRVLKLGQLRVPLGHEERILAVQLGDILGVDREVVGRRVAAGAGAAVAAERLAARTAAGRARSGPAARPGVPRRRAGSGAGWPGRLPGVPKPAPSRRTTRAGKPRARARHGTSAGYLQRSSLHPQPQPFRPTAVRCVPAVRHRCPGQEAAGPG